MDLAQGDVGTLVLGQQHDLVTVGDLCGATDNNPMLCAVMVHLQTERTTRLDHNTFDLEALTRVHTVIHTPRACDMSVVQGLRHT